MTQSDYNDLMSENNDAYRSISIFYDIYNFIYSFCDYCVKHRIII